MTGICGIWHRNGRDASEDCARMRRALKIYGPHREGQWDGGAVSLGIQLFRTLPEDRFDRQPLADGGGRFVLVADVRLDNRPELAAELGWSPEQTRTAADADYVLAAWERWQDASLDHLIGDWAIAVWDKEKRTITLARDMMGMRPLFYHAGKDFFAFAGMVKGLHALPDIPIAPDLDTLRDSLAAIPKEETASFYEKISMVEAGGKAMLHADGRIETGRWYDWSAFGEREVTDDALCIEEFRSIFDRAVSDRLRTTGGVASELSSGFDSSAVATTAAGILAKAGKRLTAYTYVPVPGLPAVPLPGRVCNEGPAAAATAAHFANIDHVLVDAGDHPIGDCLDAFTYYSDVPFFHLENLDWRSELYRRMRKGGQTVLLNGGIGGLTISWDGRDRLHEEMRKGHFSTWLHEARALSRIERCSWPNLMYRTVAPWLSPPCDHALHRFLGKSCFDLEMVSSFNPSFLADREFRERLRVSRSGRRHRRYAGIRAYGLARLSEAGDGASATKGLLAAFGVTTCTPAADRRLIEFSIPLPARMWLRDGWNKWLYRQAFRDRVPDAVMRQRQRGFVGTDFPARLRQSKARLDAEIAQVLSDPVVRELVDADFLAEFAARPLPGLADIMASRYRFKGKTMSAIALAHFVKKTRGGN